LCCVMHATKGLALRALRNDGFLILRKTLRCVGVA